MDFVFKSTFKHRIQSVTAHLVRWHAAYILAVNGAAALTLAWLYLSNVILPAEITTAPPGTYPFRKLLFAAQLSVISTCYAMAWHGALGIRKLLRSLAHCFQPRRAGQLRLQKSLSKARLIVRLALVRQRPLPRRRDTTRKPIQ